MTEVRSYTEPCQRLIRLKLLEAVPPMPERMPQYDDEEPLGVQFFRFRFKNGDLSNLTLPRTFVCRSWIVRSSFRHSDLQESNLCWNDFVEVDFSGANLRSADLRASQFERVLFIGAKLDGADMRQSDYVDCDFTDASLCGAILTHAQKRSIRLSAEQALVVAWSDDDGPEPDGG